MLLHQKVTYFNSFLTYKRLKVLFSAQKTKLMYMNQCSTVEVTFEKELLLRQCKERSGLSTRRHQCLGALFHVGLQSNKDTYCSRADGCRKGREL